VPATGRRAVLVRRRPLRTTRARGRLIIPPVRASIRWVDGVRIVS
jgi:hypothetical protein